MSKFFKIFNYIVLTIGTFLIIWFFYSFFKDDDSYPPVIIDFNAENVVIKSEKPFYFYKNDSLFYSKTGQFETQNKAIWTGTIANNYERYVFVSPNSNYIAINVDNKKVLVLSNSGEIIKEIEPIFKSFCEEDRETGDFWGENLQWNEESTALYFMQDKKWIKNYSKKNRSSLYKLTISSRKLEKVFDLDEECVDSYFLSRNENFIYYRFADSKGNLAYKKLNLINGKLLDSFYSDSLKKVNIPVDSIYINYRLLQFGNFSFDQKRLITSIYGQSNVGGIYLFKDSISKLLIKGKYGYASFKGNTYSYLNKGSFLPGNRFYAGRINSKDINGTILIDTDSLKYGFYKDEVEFFFSVTIDDQPDFKMSYELEPNIKRYETSIQYDIDKKKN